MAAGVDHKSSNEATVLFRLHGFPGALQLPHEIKARSQRGLSRLPTGGTGFPLAVTHSYGGLKFAESFSNVPADTIVMNLTCTEHTVWIDEKCSSKGHTLIL